MDYLATDKMTTSGLKLRSDEVVSRVLRSEREAGLCVLDSCGNVRDSSRMMYVGFRPREVWEYSGSTAESLRALDEMLAADEPTVFTLAYDFGRKLQGVGDEAPSDEPDLFVARFESLIAYDYARRELIASDIKGGEGFADDILNAGERRSGSVRAAGRVRSNFTKGQYLDAVEEIKEYIRSGDTYQTNLTQQISVDLCNGMTPANVFISLRRKHPAPFSAYIERPGSTVVSASPERFFRVTRDSIEASPIKGTSPRGQTPAEDTAYRAALLASKKDRAENTMIVDLMRNDLGRVCEYGSIAVRELCAIRELPTMFHLESKVTGHLRSSVRPSDILKALFPCGSITGAPKVRTMQIIDELEPDSRGLSMGAIGLYIPDGFGLPPVLDLSVAIRTMVIRDGRATFNVGGGIVIDSDPAAEYRESLLKARALLDALGTTADELSE